MHIYYFVQDVSNFRLMSSKISLVWQKRFCSYWNVWGYNICLLSLLTKMYDFPDSPVHIGVWLCKVSPGLWGCLKGPQRAGIMTFLLRNLLSVSSTLLRSIYVTITLPISKTRKPLFAIRNLAKCNSRHIFVGYNWVFVDCFQHGCRFLSYMWTWMTEKHVKLSISLASLGRRLRCVILLLHS